MGFFLLGSGKMGLGQGEQCCTFCVHVDTTVSTLLAHLSRSSKQSWLMFSMRVSHTGIFSFEYNSITVIFRSWTGAFDIYDHQTQLADSKCAELSSYDKVEQSWMITCSPIGLGTEHQIYVSINGREVVSATKMNFAKPSITSSTPTPYNANGEEIIIRGLNLGGVNSPTEVNISHTACLGASWEPSYDTDGLPFVKCRSQRDIVSAIQVDTTAIIPCTCSI